MYETGNPVPSSALEDMADNAQTFDALVTKTEGTTTDRNGITRRVFQQILMDMCFQPLAGSFQTGATITARNQCLLDESTGTFYSWNGALPKVVADGSTPATAGGIGALLWVDRTDLMLRADINIVQKRFACVEDMVADTSLTVGKIIETIGYYNGWAAVASTPIGGNRYEIVAAGTGTADAGAFINLSNGLQAKGLFTSDVCIAQFGAKIDGVTDDLTAIHSALSAMAYKRQVLIPDGTTCVGDSIELPNGSDVVCDATIKLTALSWGGTVVAVYGKKDIRWNGGVIDGNSLAGQNGFSVGWYNSEAPSNVFVSDLLIKNCAWDVTTLGGKAVALHQGCTNVKFHNITSDDCSIGFSVEGLYDAAALNKVSHGIHLSNFLIRRANRTAVWLYQGAAANIKDPNSYSAILDNIIIEDCTPTSGMGVISCDRANAVKLTATINNASNATAVQLARGSMTNCNFDISAIVANCSGVVDFAPHSGGGGYASLNNKLDIILNVLTSSSGYLVSYSSSYVLTATMLKIQYINFVGSGLFNNINSSVTFDLLRLSDGYRVAGNSTDGTIPSVVAAYHTYLMGNFATEGLLLAHSAANAVGIVKAVVSTEQLRFDSGAGNTMMQTIEPTAGQVALLIRNNNGSARLSQVTLGATDSGGTGYKLLRVPN